MKDNFSTQSSSYASFRPGYPAELLEYIFSLVEEHQHVWDCGTGNGQLAMELAKSFKEVYATDISQAQLDQAVKHPAIIYSLQPAEKVDFPDDFFDLITVAQAIHWFDFGKFYAEVRRTARKGCVLAVIGYGGIEVSPELDQIKKSFYREVVGPYWDQERKYIDEEYQTIPFPFEEIKAPVFSQTLHWTKEHYIGYLNTWSAVKHFIAKNGFNPVDQLIPEIENHWGKEESRAIQFPLFLRIGKVH